MPNKKQRGVGKKKDKVVTPNHWSRALIASMNDQTLIMAEDELTVTIRDKYPKAKHHYLIIAREDISGPSKLNQSHLPLLYHMVEIAEGMEKQHDIKCKIGFHAVPSLERLHLHVVSDDFISSFLKNKKHWNSFNTEFFIKAQDMIEMIKTNGRVKEISKTLQNQLMSLPLKCHKCNFAPSNMPKFKEHLFSHHVD